MNQAAGGGGADLIERPLQKDIVGSESIRNCVQAGAVGDGRKRGLDLATPASAQRGQQVIDRFKKINEKFAGEMNFECESECDKDETGYWRSWGWTVHICPAWFKLTSPDARTEDILFIAIAEELGMDYGPKIGTPAYASLSDKQAYDSASAYVGYARDVTKKFFP